MSGGVWACRWMCWWVGVVGCVIIILSSVVVVQYQKARKRQQKLEKQQQKDVEKDNMKKVPIFSEL